jgi:hypothetical protein
VLRNATATAATTATATAVPIFRFGIESPAPVRSA